MISSEILVDETDFWVVNNLELPESEVQVWQADLDALLLNPSSARLSEDEYARADRFRFSSDRNRFMMGRRLLRVLLSAYLKTDLTGVSFDYSPNGKPSLPSDYGASEIKFNVSHSDKMALFAFVRGKEVGIDVELVRRDISIKEIAERFFSPAEQAAFAELSEELKPEAFFRCWTRKEAFVKAKGNGLSLPLDQFDVSLLPGQPARLLGTRPDPEEQHRWSICELDVGADYAASLVIEGKGMRVIEKPISSLPSGLREVTTRVE